MYTTKKQPLAKLRTYARELTERYQDAMGRQRYDDARTIRERRTRVWRAILVWQEWEPDVPPAEILERIQQLPG